MPTRRPLLLEALFGVCLLLATRRKHDPGVVGDAEEKLKAERLTKMEKAQ